MANCGALAVLACLVLLSTVQAANVTLVPGLPVSGKFYIQDVVPSLTAGAGGTTPGGGTRRLLQMTTGRSLLVANATTTDEEATSTAAALNAILAANSGRKLLQTTPGLEIFYAAKKSPLSGRVTVVLEFPSTPGNTVILTAAVTQQPAGAIAPPATFFNAEVAIGTAVGVSSTGFLAVNGGIVRVRLTFDSADFVLPQLQFSWQYASNLPAPQPAFFFLNANTVFIDVDKAGLPTFKGLIDTLI